jgi:hypothetical protein
MAVTSYNLLTLQQKYQLQNRELGYHHSHSQITLKNENQQNVNLGAACSLFRHHS